MSLIAAALATGMLVPLQLAFNGQLGQVTRNPVTAALIVFALGAAVLGAVALLARHALPPWRALAAAPPTIWLGGVIAALYILAIVWVTPRLGVAATAVLIICGQMVMAVALDHFGAFGMQRLPVTPLKLAGLALVVGGAVAVRAG